MLLFKVGNFYRDFDLLSALLYAESLYFRNCVSIFMM